MPPPGALTHCANCYAPLSGPYCAACGQKAEPLNPTLRDVLDEAVPEFLSVDNKILASVRKLVLSPGTLTRELFAGRKMPYAPPLRLYLLFSVVFFAVSAFAPANFRVNVTANPGDDPADREAMEARGARIQAAAQESLPVWIPRAMFVLVPLFAGAVRVVTRRSGRNYPQALYFSLHVLAACFAVAALGAALRVPKIPWLTSFSQGLVLLYTTCHLVIAFRRAYDLPWTAALWRAAVVGSVFMMSTVAAFLAIILPLLDFRK